MAFFPLSAADPTVRWFPRAVALTGLLWLGLLAAVLSVPYLTDSPTRGDDLIRNTVRLSLLYYAAAVSLLLLAPAQRDASSGCVRLARWLWTLAWAAFLVHLGMAFHHAHHWSHAHAVEHTRAVSGVGEGIYFSHLFTFVWTVDVLVWWLWPRRHARRSPWVGWALHGFMAFMIFNGTVVFEDGPIRWAGAVLFTWLGALLIYRPRSHWASGAA